MAAKKKPRRSIRSRSHNPKGATTLNIPCLKTEKTRWETAAAEEAKDMGLTHLPLAQWARKILNARSDPSAGIILSEPET